MNKELRFYQALEDIFVGAKIEGDSGYINLLKIKEKYYSSILEKFKDDVDGSPVIKDAFKEEFFDKLYTFFDRYFSESGSVYFTKTANWQNIYEKVYTDNKDVILFWKTHMLYYVKTDILFKSIDVTVEDEDNDKIYNFYFDVGTLESKQNNEKRQIIYEYKDIKKREYENKKGEMETKEVYLFNVMYSTHGRKTKIDDIVRKTDISDVILKKAFNTFEKQSEVDFFINKNAKVFLTEQLDLYLHQMLLNDENKFEQTRLNQIKTIKEFALKIIDFISQFEDELVRIWNKPKFVLNSNYVISLDKLTDKGIEKISQHPNLKKQITEWIELGIVDVDFDFNRRTDEQSYLPIDTKYFKDLEIEILNTFDNIDKALDGRLIHSENYQALNTLKKKYKEKIQCVYLDPPFNTGNDFVFLDKFQDSTWLNIIDDRLEIAKHMISETGCVYLHLDHIAEHYGRILLDNHFGIANFKSKITWNTGDNISGFKSQAKNWIRQADYIHFYVKNNDEYKFTKAYELLDKNNIELGWLDVLGKNKNDLYIEKWIDGELRKKTINQKVKAKGTIWNDIYSFQYSEPRITESLSFVSNQKPENLLRRIIQTSSDRGDIVLDFFCGSGTTCAVAHKLNRKWIGVEMGNYFNEIYIDEVNIPRQSEETEENNDAIISIISETSKTRTVQMKKIGMLGRMKIILNGDKEFKVIHSPINRRPHLSKDINWQGGGFFKYYSLEQYEDTLRNVRYKDDQIDLFNDKNPFEEYIFFSDNKLADILEIEQDDIKLNFDKLYENIDWPETISNLLGLPIKKIYEKSFILGDDEEEREINIDFKNMTDDEKVEFIGLIKPLIWWGA